MDKLLGKAEEDQTLRGDLLFLEGGPVDPPVVERDVVNPIFGAYYRDSNTAPGSYLSPSPIFFLALGSPVVTALASQARAAAATRPNKAPAGSKGRSPS
jgi:CRISPR/Cas system CMR subunit Cmr6 (Cas7 group RAMP superfamily)